MNKKGARSTVLPSAARCQFIVRPSFCSRKEQRKYNTRNHEVNLFYVDFLLLLCRKTKIN